MTIRVLCWNLFHGRDAPPDPRLFTWRSRLFAASERNETHIQVNRDLFRQFAGLLEGGDWDVALLQESPPRWASGLAERCSANHHVALTSRNSFGRMRGALARRNPDLLGSWEGGSNLTLVRESQIAERHAVALRRWPERRVVALTRLRAGDGGSLRIANLHASTGARRAEEDVRRAAHAAAEWAGDDPLIFGGDMNLRPEQTGLFKELERDLGLCGELLEGTIDHLLARGLEQQGPAQPSPPAARELTAADRRLRLSDHAPVKTTFVARQARE